MNAADDGKEPRGRELVPEAWRELDDTLADGPAPADLPAEAKPWLGDQRYLHGLLRALHTQDAAAREARITGILERVDQERTEPRTHWLRIAVAALLMACFGIWLALPTSLPTADAAVQRAVAELARDVARRYRVTMHMGERGALGREFALVTRPGGRFRIDGKITFGELQLGEVRLGSDGQETWIYAANGMFRNTAPVAERERLERRLGNVLDLGHLDLHELVKKLPTDFELRVVGRESDSAGRHLLRIEAVQTRADTGARLRSAWLLCDEATDMVTRIEVEFAGVRGPARHMQIEYLGEEPPGLVDFARPW